MNSVKHHHSKHVSKKGKKLIKLIKPNSESEDDDSEHELSHYLNDRVKMMKEVLKIIKPKRIRSMAPDCMKKLDNEEINSMLLEELLGISNKRLKYIFNGQAINEESSSTDPEDQPIDVISLDDISDDDLIINLDSEPDNKEKIKEEPKRKKVKKEKHHKESKSKPSTDNPMSEKNLMSVLELLELQARARAIKSQLALENRNSETEIEISTNTPIKKEDEDNDDDDAVIVEIPKSEEILITSSESENEGKSFWRNSDRFNSNKDNNNKNGDTKLTSCSQNNKIKILQQATIKNVSTPNENSSQHKSNFNRQEDSQEYDEIPLPNTSTTNRNANDEIVQDNSCGTNNLDQNNSLQEINNTEPAGTQIFHSSETELNATDKNRLSTNSVEHSSNAVDDADGIVLNVEQAEMDYLE